jgi:hypothetical protein
VACHRSLVVFERRDEPPTEARHVRLRHDPVQIPVDGEMFS